MSFTVTAAEFALTVEKVAKLNKRAAKAGIAAVATLVEIGRRQVTETTEIGFSRTYTVVEAEITGLEDVRLGAWALAATLDHDVAGNIFRTVPGFPVEIPAEFRGTDATRCDHCGVRRQRNQTILVWNETEGFKQVGSDCVKLFLGVSVSSLIAWIAEIEDIENDDELGSYWGRQDYSVSEFVAAAALVTETYGFKPSSFDGASTRSVASSLLSSFSKDWFRKDCPELVRPEAVVVERANKLAAEALAWVLETESNGNEYLLNLKIAARREALGKNAGLLASLPNTYKRHLGLVAERAAKAAAKAELPASSHQGAVGDKLTVTGTVAYTNRGEAYSYYGPESLFVIVQGADGNVFYINTTVDTKIGELLENAEKETVFTLTGAVKAHKITGKGQDVTVLTRVKAV